MASRRRVGLALAGGVAKGIAHIGVIKALLELRVPIDAIAGTSSGSLVGGLTASGFTPDKIEELTRKTKWRDLVRPVLPRLGLLDSGPMQRFLTTILGDRRIEDLAIPFAAVATDIETGREVILTQGPLAQAVRASCAVPGFFRPVRIDGRLLVDGGVSNNVPANIPRRLGADFVIAVDLSGRLGEGLTRPSVLSILLRSFEIMQHEKRAIEVKGADVVIRPRVEGIGLINLEAVDAYIAAGYEATMAQKETLADLMEQVRRRSFFSFLSPRRWRSATRG